VGSDKDSLIRQ